MDGTGGGGIGEGGTSTGSLGPVDSQYRANNSGKGGDGLYQSIINGITYDFKDYFGVSGVQDGTTGNYYIGGGGGGDNATGIGGNGGKGGGGSGGDSTNTDVGNPSNGLQNTGSGRAGGGGDDGSTSNKNGGNGSSGIVIIRYKYTKEVIIPYTPNGFLEFDNTTRSWNVKEQITYNKISDSPFILTQLSDLTGTISSSSITGTFTYNKISNPPSIPAAVTSLPYTFITGAPASADIFKSTFSKVMYRESNVFSFGLVGNTWTRTFRVETNLVLNFNNPGTKVQHALPLSVSPYVNSITSQRHIFASVFYSQITEFFSDTTHKSVETWILDYVWNNAGNNYITITVTTPETIEYLNVNIR